MSEANEVDYERAVALNYQIHTGEVMYLFDDSGNEYWYSEQDTRRHYTREEG